MSGCTQCGQCCVDNGLIPPLTVGIAEDDDAPEWLRCLVNRLRTEFGGIAEEYPCVFLTDDMRCSIYDMARPEVCVGFSCKDD